MSDKPLIQEKLADEIGSIVHCMNDTNNGIKFFGMFLKTMSQEWFGIDQWRIDKFMMLVRRVTRQVLTILHNLHWDPDVIELLNTQVESTVLRKTESIGFFMHFTEIFMEETAKVSFGNIPESSITDLVKPYATFIAKTRDFKLARHVVKHIFNNLLFQSELGREYKDKFDAWKQAGFPGNSIDEMELVEQNFDDEQSNSSQLEDEDDDKNGKIGALDPRAGRVDVFMPEIKFEANEVIEVLEDAARKPYSNVKSRRMLDQVVKNYNKFVSGTFPLGIQKIKLKSDNIEAPKIIDKVNALVQFENKLYQRNKLPVGLKNKKRKYPKQLESTDAPSAKKPKLAAVLKRRKHFTNEWKEDDIKNTTGTDDDSNSISNVNKEEVIPLTAHEFTVHSGVDAKWAEPLLEGETEYYVPSRKVKLAELNTSVAPKQQLVVNPAALKGKQLLSRKSLTPNTSSSEKKVKIMLKFNRSQDTNEYIKQLRSSPNLPYDSSKKPKKGLLKPNLMPSPINPFYKKKLGLNFD